MMSPGGASMGSPMEKHTSPTRNFKLQAKLSFERQKTRKQ